MRDNPDADPALVGIAEELDEKHALSVLAETEGGKLLIESLLKDIASTVTTLTVRYKDGTHTDLVALCAKLDGRLDMYHALTRAKTHRKELQQILNDALNV